LAKAVLSGGLVVALAAAEFTALEIAADTAVAGTSLRLVATAGLGKGAPFGVGDAPEAELVAAGVAEVAGCGAGFVDAGVAS
jgi:hypothetical protein